MDIDALSAARAAQWTRLDELSRRRRLSGAEADELIERYQAASADLAAISSTAGSTAVGTRLAVSLSRARGRLTGTRAEPLAAVSRFVVLSLPAALYRLRWLTLVVALATAVVATLYAVWILGDPRLLAALGDDEELRRFASGDFIDYYSENPAASFAGQVWTNNAWIAAQCVAFGIVGIFVPYILLQNAQNLGTSIAVMFHAGEGDTFFLYIAPHGQLELTAVFVAAAAGLRIFWAWIAPGARTRGQALAEDARSLFTVAIGLVFVLLVSGVIEGFVTPAPWPWWLKIGIGALALGAFLVYMIVVGGRATRAGETGDLDRFEAGSRSIAAS
ncbi:stage II sporulation protein M [Rathayibacter rathayi]|uniref:Stage II sporulation protein M n=1 Tax=Rathayibacter rathayi TaxID=33887 RepID=A0ABD6WAI3_RATRA|nr:stage II sporulation protein M [Rathayibacter rathayi]AZZ49328.1 stage II sporulation protein M [Rathayibacter rathayi]MWV73417.1 stage II sporulation protein M [Rathayibacter rathayi NCPPB 2980 = VKM Ac-1601]PPF15040.1 stage II sporulation protein M [Rathayibacter rathayi]PPF50317.1 stage II sporulation protein M [Rathayibacter rathayi]PPF81180.1 stage II sporulation protein M [Rathayibacter rathayi]